MLDKYTQGFLGVDHTDNMHPSRDSSGLRIVSTNNINFGISVFSIPPQIEQGI